jgi:hypothetical protein
MQDRAGSSSSATTVRLSAWRSPRRNGRKPGHAGGDAPADVRPGLPVDPPTPGCASINARKDAFQPFDSADIETAPRPVPAREPVEPGEDGGVVIDERQTKSRL